MRLEAGGWRLEREAPQRHSRAGGNPEGATMKILVKIAMTPFILLVNSLLHGPKNALAVLRIYWT